MALNSNETARLEVIQAKPVAQQTVAEKAELAALIAKRNSQSKSPPLL